LAGRYRCFSFSCAWRASLSRAAALAFLRIEVKARLPLLDRQRDIGWIRSIAFLKVFVAKRLAQ
jgi:hypothetical protein